MFVSYPTGASMLRAMQDFAESKAGDRTLLERMLARIERISTRLKPFFQVIEIFVSSNPEYAAIAWGSIRLIFMVRNLSSHLTIRALLRFFIVGIKPYRLFAKGHTHA